MKPKTYNPSGLVTKKPVFLRLMPDELAQAEEISSRFGLSKSKLARDAYLTGLHIVVEKLSSAAAPHSPAAAAPAGGDVPPVVAGTSRSGTSKA